MDNNSSTNNNPATAMFQCDKCDIAFTREDNLKRHRFTEHPDQVAQGVHLQCPYSNCTKQFKRRDNLLRHQIQRHNGGAPAAPLEFVCQYCGKGFGRKDNLLRHEKVHIRKMALPGKQQSEDADQNHPQVHSSQTGEATGETSQTPNPPAAVKTLDEVLFPRASQGSSSSNHSIANQLNTKMVAFNQAVIPTAADAGFTALQRRRVLRGALVSYQAKGSGVDPEAYLEGMVNSIDRKIAITLKRQTGIKLCMALNIRFYKPTEPKNTSEAFFWSRQTVVLRGNVFSEKIRSCFSKIFDAIDRYTKEGSGWTIDMIKGLEVHFSEYQPLNGSTYKTLPPKLRAKQAVLNIMNNDQKCFLWSILAHRNPVGRKNHPNHVHHYQLHENELILDGIEFPMKLTQIPKFERQNNLSINVYGFENELIPLYLSDRNGPHIGLVLYNEHYSLVRNLNRLLSDQRGGHRTKWFCHRCLFPFYSRGRRDDHVDRCGNDTKITMSEKASIKFENVHRAQKQPLVVYCDFECLTEKMDTAAQNPTRSSTEKYQKHTPCGFGLVEARSCCGAAEFKEPVIYRGPDCVSRFLRELQGIAMDYHERLDNAPGITMTEANQQAHESSTCHICEKLINDPENKVRDHCHICGRYRGPAHNQCNQAYRLKRDIVVVFHNLRRYDGHIIMQYIAQSCSLFGWEPSCIARSMEDYLGFSLHTAANKEEGTTAWNIKFVDSAQFLSASLDALVKALPRDRFHALRQSFNDIDLLLRKGVYPYDYMDNWDRFHEDSLPPKPAFHSKLNQSDVSDEDYEHAIHVWHEFGIRNMGMFHDHYLKSDTLQLADIVEEFRGVCMKNYGLDPMHYITLPSFAWDACLKLTGIQLETIQDPDQYAFLENGIRGGISVIMQRHCKANNPKCPDYDPSKPRKYIVYLDANNLYGWAMVQDLPTHGFQWIDDLNSIDWTNTTDGFIVEVDLEYPSNLHDEHNDYPLAPERMTPTDLSPYCQALQEQLENASASGPKLIPNLHPKKNYICHIRNLQQYLKYGMVLKKVHRALGFQQSAWMKPYIELNTRLRTAATTDFEKNLFKLMNNAVFGKTMENVRKYRDVKLVIKPTQFRKLVANPRYRRACIFDDNFVGVMMERKTVCLDKPVYVGFTVLDLSKTLMYDFHYGHMLPKYGDRAKLMFTDTDSFIYAIQTENIYADMAGDHAMYDTSDYPHGHPLQSNANKKVLGKMKDEMNGVPIAEFVGLRSKMYSFLDANGQEKKRAKGIKKSTVKNEIRFADYKQALFQRNTFLHRMNQIRSDAHQLYSVTLTKKSLSPYDDKRFILEDGINTLAYGHTDIDFFRALSEPMDWEPSA